MAFRDVSHLDVTTASSRKHEQTDRQTTATMTALFNFQSLLLVILLLICTSTYVHQMFPTLLDNRKQGVMGIFWKSARIGERLSPYISLCCVFMAFSLLVGN